MTLPTSGAITLADLQTEFGGSNPISLGEYYAGGSYVVSGEVGFPGGVSTPIPSSGAISLNTFHGAGKVYYLDVLAVGGGGGGGSGWPDSIGGGGGGGGGGGFAALSSLPFVLSGFSGSITVGAGGTAYNYPTTQSGNGGDSIFYFSSAQYALTGTHVGGGYGGYGRDPVWNLKGGNGGFPAGNAGGSWGGSSGGSDGVHAGGGGGGVDDSTPGGAGGNGVVWSVNGVTYSGGGGGGSDYSSWSTGGSGGGGAGAPGGQGQAGTNGLGGGGGGGGSNGQGNGGNGGSGVVIVSYVSATQLLTGGTVTNAGGRYFHTFTTVGSSTLTAL